MSFEEITEDNLTSIVQKNLTHGGDLRQKEILESFVAHAMAFIKETRITHPEWMAGIKFLETVADWTDEKRNEFILLSDCLGISAMVDLISDSHRPGATPATGLGPFHVPGQHLIENDQSILTSPVPGAPLWFKVNVTDQAGNAVPECDIEVWQAHAEGLYDVQEDAGSNMRARLRTDENGYAAFLGVMPNGYPLPPDGPCFEKLGKYKPSIMRPAHIHLIAEASGFERLVTHVFPANDEHLNTDPVFGVRRNLILSFEQISEPAGNEPETLMTPYWTATFNLSLAAEKPKT